MPAECWFDSSEVHSNHDEAAMSEQEVVDLVRLSGGLIGQALRTLREQLMHLDELKLKVEQQATVVQSAVTLLTSLKQQLDEAIATGDMGKVQEVSDMIGGNTAALSAAVAANTPAQ